MFVGERRKWNRGKSSRFKPMNCGGVDSNSLFR